MKRVVLDTNVLVAGLRSRNGASFAILRLVADRRLRPLATTALFLEYEAVLKRPQQHLAHGFSAQELDSLIAELAALSEPVETHFLWRPQLVDPQDEMVLECAINGRADALVTHNVGDFVGISDRFSLRVLRPQELLEGLRS
jgi:putative PIN family toxin of toxin-antitoxin system